MTDLLLYVVFPAAALLLFLLRKLPAGPVLHRQRWPSIVSLGLQILWSAVTKRSKAVLDGQNIPSIEVGLKFLYLPRVTWLALGSPCSV